MRRHLPTANGLAATDPYAGLAFPPSGWVALGMVTSLDGRVTLDGRSGDLGGTADLAAFRALRALADAVLVGAGTVRAEDYGPPAARDVAARRARGQRDAPVVAVVSRSLDLDPASRLFADPDHRPVVLTTRDAPADRRAALEAVADVVTTGDGDVPPAAALAALRDRDLGRVVCEGGPTINRLLLAAGVVDELFVTLAPTLVGTGGPHLVEGDLDPPVDLVLHEVRSLGSELLLRYRVLGPR